MTKAEFIARMERDIDEDTEVGCFVISGNCAKGTVIYSGIGGRPMDVFKFVTRTIRIVAERLGTEPKVLTGAVGLMLEVGSDGEKITVDMDAVEAAKGGAHDADR